MICPRQGQAEGSHSPSCAQKCAPRGLAPWFSQGPKWGWPAHSSLDCPFGLFFFLRWSCVTTFSKSCYIQAATCTPSIIYVQSFCLLPVVIFLIIPVYLKLFGGMEWEMFIFLWTGNSPSDSWECQCYSNAFCTHSRNSTPSPKACPSSSSAGQGEVALYLRLSPCPASTYRISPSTGCVRYHRLSSRSNWQVRRHTSVQRFIQYIAENEAHPIITCITPLWTITPPPKKKSAKRSVFETLVYLPRGYVLGGFQKYRDPGNKKKIVDQ